MGETGRLQYFTKGSRVFITDYITLYLWSDSGEIQLVKLGKGKLK